MKVVILAGGSELDYLNIQKNSKTDGKSKKKPGITHIMEHYVKI